MTTILLLGGFIVELLLLFFVSRISINDLFKFFYRFTHSENIVFSLISIIFLPGTIVHELSHFFMAIILFLKVRSIKVFPEWEKNNIKLGSVTYEKQDVFRSILVGVAPIFVGLFLFWAISLIHPFQISSILLKILLIYFIFVLSSTMFSSKQDLVDIIYILPVVLIVAAVIYIFQINIISLFNDSSPIVQGFDAFLYAIISYIGVALGIHLVFISVTRLLHNVFKI